TIVAGSAYSQEGFRLGLRDLGWLEGESISFEPRAREPSQLEQEARPEATSRHQSHEEASVPSVLAKKWDMCGPPLSLAEMIVAVSPGKRHVLQPNETVGRLFVAS